MKRQMICRRSNLKNQPHKKKIWPNYTTWSPKQPVINGCFNWMVPNLYIGNGCFTKHLFINGCLEFQVFHQPGFPGTKKATETGGRKKKLKTRDFVASEFNLVESCVNVEALEGQVISKWVNLGCGPLPSNRSPTQTFILPSFTGRGGHNKWVNEENLAVTLPKTNIAMENPPF